MDIVYVSTSFAIEVTVITEGILDESIFYYQWRFIIWLEHCRSS